jgi:trehalose 6-phosphate synthase
MWSKDALHELIHTQLGARRFILVGNREPYQHRFAGGSLQCVPPASGMVSALEPILCASGGTWVAHGSGNADRHTVDRYDHVSVPPDDPRYTLRRVWLTQAQEEGYYYGLANEGLWPLCHMVFTRPVFNPKHWSVYREVNELFARAVLREAGDDPAFVFVQDYHFGILPRLLKDANPHLIVAQFWHIPWPGPEVFQTFPWKEELLDALLGNDLLGFHLRCHCLNFLNTVDRTLEAKVDYERLEVTRRGKVTVVRPFPISIDAAEHEQTAQSAAVVKAMDRWRQQLQLTDKVVGIGIDRLDYTKGIPERLRALNLFLEQHPQYRRRLRFIQIGVPTRTHIAQYKALDDEVDRLVDEVNRRWGTDTWQPIVYLKQQHGPVELMALHRLADFCIVSSLDDGMNLVAKEFVASRYDGDGVLILSRFTGAARELTSAVLVNPFATGEIAEAIFQSLTMPADERRHRMRKMRAVVMENNIYRWAGKVLSTLFRFEVPATLGHAPDAHAARLHVAVHVAAADGCSMETSHRPSSIASA